MERRRELLHMEGETLVAVAAVINTASAIVTLCTIC